MARSGRTCATSKEIEATLSRWSACSRFLSATGCLQGQRVFEIFDDIDIICIYGIGHYGSTALLSGDKDRELTRNFERVEEERVGHGKHGEFHRMMGRLKAVYRI